MKRRQYLTEDVEQIRRYFPGARTVSLRTPFDLTPKASRAAVDVFRAEELDIQSWQEGVFGWTI